mmetsp:Transcript_22965/g.56653  ORF Transcript_22965/g.56653 Transcript_22965/m.56653 type:complete len:231 (+) Transcript_22965:293-985(+)
MMQTARIDHDLGACTRWILSAAIPDELPAEVRPVQAESPLVDAIFPLLLLHTMIRTTPKALVLVVQPHRSSRAQAPIAIISPEEGLLRSAICTDTQRSFANNRQLSGVDVVKSFRHQRRLPWIEKVLNLHFVRAAVGEGAFHGMPDRMHAVARLGLPFIDDVAQEIPLLDINDARIPQKQKDARQQEHSHEEKQNVGPPGPRRGCRRLIPHQLHGFVQVSLRLHHHRVRD